MKLNVQVQAGRTTTTLNATISVEMESESSYGRPEPVVGTVEKALTEGRKAALAILSEKTER